MYSMTPPQQVGGLRVSSDYSEKNQKKAKKREIRLDATGDAVFFLSELDGLLKLKEEQSERKTPLHCFPLLAFLNVFLPFDYSLWTDYTMTNCFAAWWEWCNCITVSQTHHIWLGTTVTEGCRWLWSWLADWGDWGKRFEASYSPHVSTSVVFTLIFESRQEPRNPFVWCCSIS